MYEVNTVLKTKFHKTLTAKITDKQRAAIDNLAKIGELSIGEATRAILDAGIAAKGIA